MVKSKLIEKILLFVDASEETVSSAMFAITLAKMTGAQLFSVYVVDQESIQELLKARIFVEAEEHEYAHDLEEDGKRYLTLVERLASERDVPVQSSLLKGTIHEEIRKKIKKEDIDLLIISKLEETVSRLDAYYDENERLLRFAQCPVLVIKNHEKIEEFFETKDF